MAFTTTDQHESGYSANRVEKSRPLVGLKAISLYVGRSRATVMKFIRDEDFPAVKIGGTWEADEDHIDVWRLRRLGE